MPASAKPSGFDREPWRQAADWMLVALAASLPWSTTATLILAALWLIALLPTLERQDVRTVLASPAAWLVLALIGFGALGMLWADVTFKERISGFDSYVKLFAIPLLFMHLRHSAIGWRVLHAFILSCALLLALAVLSYFFAGSFERLAKMPGVPVKDYLAQSAVFSLAAMGCFLLARQSWERDARSRAVGFLALGIAFLIDITFLISSRTALVSIPVLLLVLVIKTYDGKRAAAFAAIIAFAALAVGLLQPTVSARLAKLWSEVEIYRADNTRTSAGERLEFWKKSVGFIAQAPLLGHGTGTIRSRFERVASGQGASALIAANPHNQTLAVGIQLGFAGMALLFAMWLAHLALFRGAGLAAAIGALVVVQNIAGSLFNSHLFDFTHGWLYVIGVGVAGGVVLAQRERADISHRDVVAPP
ncbi:MAG: O-antigen ligase family protein [Pseudorhodoplanes sp.]